MSTIPKYFFVYNGRRYSVHLRITRIGFPPASVTATVRALLRLNEIDFDQIIPEYSKHPKLIEDIMNTITVEGMTGTTAVQITTPEGEHTEELVPLAWETWAALGETVISWIITDFVQLREIEDQQIDELREFYGDDEREGIMRFRGDVDAVFWMATQATATITEAAQAMEEWSVFSLERYLHIKGQTAQKDDDDDETEDDD